MINGMVYLFCFSSLFEQPVKIFVAVFFADIGCTEFFLRYAAEIFVFEIIIVHFLHHLSDVFICTTSYFKKAENRNVEHSTRDAEAFSPVTLQIIHILGGIFIHPFSW